MAGPSRTDRHPAEIWVGFARSAESGRVLPRRRYIKVIRTGKNRAIALVADMDGGVWSGLTFFRARPRSLDKLRGDLPIYRM